MNEWFNVVKARKYYTFENSVPQMYHFLTRLFAPEEKRNPAFHKKYKSWIELDTNDQARIVEKFIRMDKQREEAEKQTNPRWWSHSYIPGIIVEFMNDGYPIVNEAEFQHWRKSAIAEREDENNNTRAPAGMGGYSNWSWFQRNLYKELKEIFRRNIPTSRGYKRRSD
mgnify:FL=1